MPTTTKLAFEHEKPYVTNSGKVITMKAVRTINGKQYVECYESPKWYQPHELTEVHELPESVEELEQEQEIKQTI